MKCLKCFKELDLKMPEGFRGFVDGRCDCGKRFGYFHSNQQESGEVSKGDTEVYFEDGKIKSKIKT